MGDSDRRSMPPLSRETIGAVVRACARSAAVAHEEMKQGLGALATIASLVPWLGLLGTIECIVNSFTGGNGEKSWLMAVTFGRLSQSMWPTAIGLLMGLTSLWCRQYLAGRLEAFDREMQDASLGLVNQLGRFKGRWQFAPTTEPDSRPMFGALSPAELSRDQRFWDRAMIVTGAALFLAWCAQAARYFQDYSLSLASVAWAACESVVFVFCASCIPARVLWPWILRRRRGGLVALASVLCLCWSIVRLLAL